MQGRIGMQGVGRAAALVAMLFATSCASSGAPSSGAGFVSPAWPSVAAPDPAAAAAPSVALSPASPGSGGALETSYDAPLDAAGGWTTHAAPAAVSVAPPEDGEGPGDVQHVSLYFGGRAMSDDGDWDPVDDQFTFGGEYDSADAESGHGFEAGMLLSGDDDDDGPNDVSVAAFQAYGGWRKTFRHGERGVQPYVGAGVTIIWTAYEVDTPTGDDDDDDLTPGLYARVGVMFDVASRVRCGVDYRHVFADDVELEGVDLDGDADLFMFTVGYRF